MKILILYVKLIFISHAKATDNFKMDFIKSFIENERKPTHLMFNLCWKKEKQMTLMKEVSTIGVRSSPTMQTGRYLDHGLLFLLDFECEDAEELLLTAFSNNLHRSPYRWLVISNSSNYVSRPVLQEAPILVDSDFVVAERGEEGYRMLELHRVSLNHTMESTLRGYFDGIFRDVRPHKTLFRRRKNLKGVPVTVTNVIQDSNTSKIHLPIEDRLELEHDFIPKLSWSNTRLGILALNATPRYTFSYRWSFKINGTWSAGAIDDIRSGKADLGKEGPGIDETTSLRMTLDRLKEIAYTDNMASFRLRFIFRQPPLASVTNVFSLPFSTRVWVALAISIAAATFVLTLTSKFEARIVKYTSINNTQPDGSIGDALLVTLSALSQQGCELIPRKASGRILVVFLFSTLMALYAAYSANVVVLLQAPSTYIQTLTQLAHSKMTLAAVDVDYSHFLFKLYKDDDPIRHKIYRRVELEKAKKQFYDMDEGVQRIRQGMFAFHSVVEPVYFRIEHTFLEHEKCDLTEVDFLNDLLSHVPARKDSPYLELFRVVFKQVRESGLWSAWTRRLQTPKPRCSHKVSAFSSVSLADTLPVLIMMAYGAAISILILLLERLMHRMTKMRKKIRSASTVVLSRM